MLISIDIDLLIPHLLIFGQLGVKCLTSFSKTKDFSNDWI